MSQALRQVMIAADGAGELDGEDLCRGRAEHPVCGDVVELTWREQGGAISDLAWRASGCPATLAVAAAARGALCGAPLSQAPALLRARLAELGDLAPHERHAEKMLLRALARPAPADRGAQR